MTTVAEGIYDRLKENVGNFIQVTNKKKFLAHGDLVVAQMMRNQTIALYLVNEEDEFHILFDPQTMIIRIGSLPLKERLNLFRAFGCGGIKP